MILRGWALSEQGGAGEGIAVARAGMERFLETGQRHSLEFHLGLLADSEARAGNLARALAIVTDAERAVPGEEIYRADTLRRRAELLARQGGDAAQVEMTFRDALGVARRQGARSFELRAATCFGRWLRHQGRTAEARELLAPIYASFTEGFDTGVLVEAKALLEELA